MNCNNIPNIMSPETLTFSCRIYRNDRFTLHSLGQLPRANKRDTHDKNQAVGSDTITRTRLKTL